MIDLSIRKFRIFHTTYYDITIKTLAGRQWMNRNIDGYENLDTEMYPETIGISMNNFKYPIEDEIQVEFENIYPVLGD